MQDIVFRGLTAPLRLHDAEAVLPVLLSIAPGWAFDCVAANPEKAPFYSISARPDEPLLWCECHLDDRPRRWFDPVNAICDVVSALALALPAERPELICLHAAGVAMAGRLVVFPNIRRAGKSTLSAALAMAGFQVFSDDVVPVFFTDDRRAHGLAMGIAPRLRLPLPESIGSDFREWVSRVAGPANRQYQYLQVANQPPHGATLPIGAFVILDRQDDSVQAELSEVPPDLAMDALLYQNFTRDRHSADILQVMAETLSSRPVFRLTYSDLADAVACLATVFAQWPDPDRPARAGPVMQFRTADLDVPMHGQMPAGAKLRQQPGVVEQLIGEGLYLADAKGSAIHRMDPLATAIWSMLEVPTSEPEIEDLLVESFPGVDRDRISADLRRLLGSFYSAGLIEVVDSG